MSVDIEDRGRKRKNGPHEKATIFSHNAVTSTGGTWTGVGSTNTRQSRTLFITNLDPRTPLESVAELFKHEPGFVAFRTVRRMCFVDFQAISEANSAMRKHQHYVFPSLTYAAGQLPKKMLIDYDKDDSSKRDKQFANQIAREIDLQQNAELIDLHCVACNQFLVKLKIDAPKTFAHLPRRAIDSSIVLDTAKYVTELQLGKGEEKALRREAGVEMQYRLICRGCQLPVAYASTPFDSKIKHIFVLKGAMKGKLKQVKQGRIVTRGEQMLDMDAVIKKDAPAAVVKSTEAAASSSDSGVTAAADSAESSSSSANPPDASSSSATALAPSEAIPAVESVPVRAEAPIPSSSVVEPEQQSTSSAEDEPPSKKAKFESADSAGSESTKADAPASELAQ